MKRVLKFIIGVFLLPAAFFTLLAFVDASVYLIKGYQTTLYFLLGVILYLAMHFYVYDFSRVYVIAHEIMHAFAAMLCGYRVSSLNINEESGNVKVSNVNTFVLLAPYIIPVQALMLSLIYFCLLYLWPPVELYRNIFLATFGFFITLHFVHTYKALSEVQQSDLKMAGGNIFSLPLIVVFNIIITIALLELYFPDLIPAGSLAKKVLTNTLDFWGSALKYLWQAAVRAAKL